MVDDEIARARAVLGVSTDADWAAIRTAYRSEMRRSHPDMTGEATSHRSIELNAAYRVLARARAHPPEAAAPPVPPPPRRDGYIVGNDTIVLTSSPEESFRRLVEAAHVLGEISYLDRSSAIFEAILALEEGIHASLVVSLQWRAHDATTEAYCTLEALERAESLDPGGVVEQLVAELPPGRTD